MKIRSRKKVDNKNKLGNRFVIAFKYNVCDAFVGPGPKEFFIMANNRVPMSYENAVKNAIARSENNPDKDFYIVEVQAQITRTPPITPKFKVIPYKS